MHGTSVQIGTYNGTLALKEDWESNTYLAEYRKKLEAATKAALAKAAELQLQK